MDRPIEYSPAKEMLSEESKALMYAFTPEVRALNADYPYWNTVKYHPGNTPPPHSVAGAEVAAQSRTHTLTLRPIRV